MMKRFLSLLLAVLMLATMGIGAFADKETVDYTVLAETMKMICEKQGLDYDFCKAAIIQLNAAFDKEEDFSTKLHVGDSIKLPKTNQDAADILGVALPDKLKPKAEGKTQNYTIKSGDTVIDICKAKGLDFGKCKAAIMKLNGWGGDYAFLTLKAGTTIKLPASDADAAVIAATATATATATAVALTPAALAAGDVIVAYMVPHIVKTGETIYGICVENGVDFNRYYSLIMAASGITYATSLRTGNTVYIPSSTATTGAMKIVAHSVRTGETTYGICQDLGVSYSLYLNMISALNPGKNLSSIRTGEVLYFPTAATAATAAGGTGTGTGTGTGAVTGGGAGGYTPASADPPVTQKNPTAKEGVMFYLKEYTVATDDTVYDLLKPSGFNGENFNYYVSVMLAASGRSTFGNLKTGDKIMLAANSAAGAKIAATGVKVKNGDTLIKMCADNGVSYDDNVSLIAALNPGLNATSMKTGDIVVLPKTVA